MREVTKGIHVWLLDFSNIPTSTLEAQVKEERIYQLEERWRSFLAVRFLAQTLLQNLGLSGAVERSETGYPFLPREKDGFVSFAHTGSLALVGWSKRCIGVDVEPGNRSVRTRRPLNAFPGFSENPALAHWIAQEACGKFFRTGIQRNPPYPILFQEFPYRVEQSGEARVGLYRFKGFWIGICAEAKPWEEGHLITEKYYEQADLS